MGNGVEVSHVGKTRNKY